MHPKPEKKEKDKMTSYEFRNKYGKKAVNRNKYGAIKQNYNGYNYDSKLEATHAYELDMLINIGEVKKWERQHKISLDLNGVHIANYFIDFKVWYTDGRIEFHEVKGAETMIWRMKWKLTKALYPDYNLVLLK